MLLLQSSSALPILLALSSFSGVLAAPASGNVADIDLTYGRDGTLDSTEKGIKAKISVDNDFKVPSGSSPKYHVLAADTSFMELGVDPIVCDGKDNDTEDEDDDDSNSNDKRSTFSKLFSRGITSDQKEALNRHNSARKAVKVAALKWDTKLEADALAYAKKIAKAGKMVHSEAKTRPGQGENLAYAWSSDGYKNPMTAGTQSWYVDLSELHANTANRISQAQRKEEVQGRDHSQGQFLFIWPLQYVVFSILLCSLLTSSTAQCVWEKSTKVGIAAAQNSKTGAWYTVARYTAAGNVVGKKPY
ncbi:unnamed protein product [Fusarium graminearum]|nr:unnamed protein product [Fusarium graminearum]